MARGPFLIPSILWRREWSTRPQVGAAAEGLAAQTDRLTLALNLAGYEVTHLVLKVADPATPAVGLELESRGAISMTDWPTTTGEPWPAGAGAALGLRVMPRTLLEETVAVFALPLPSLSGATFDPGAAGWLTIALPETVTTLTDALAAVTTLEGSLREAIAQDLANAWEAATPLPPSQPNPISAGLLWMYDPAHWRFPASASSRPWLSLIDVAAWIWANVEAAPSKQDWLQAILIGDEPTLLDYLETYSIEVGGDPGSLVAEELVQLAGLQAAALAGPLGDGTRVLFEDLPDLPYTVALLLLQDLFLVNFLGAVDTFTPMTEAIYEDLAGFYECIDIGGRDTLQISQAGPYLEGDWQVRIPVATHQYLVRKFTSYSFSAFSSAASPHQFQLARSLEAPVGWRLEEVPAPGTFELQPLLGSVLDEGTLKVTPGDVPELTITIGAATVRFRLVSRRARLSEESVAGVPAQVAEKVRAAERFPLHSAEWAEVRSLAEDLLTQLAAYYSISASNLDPEEDLTRVQGAEALDAGFVAGLRATFPSADPDLEPNLFSPMFSEQTPQVLQAFRLILGSGSVDIPQSSLDGWTALAEPTSVFPRQTGYLRDFLGIRTEFQHSVRPSPSHTYEWKMMGFGLSGEVLLGGSYYRGDMLLRKLTGEPAYAKRQRFGLSVRGWSAGSGIAVHFMFNGFWNNLETPVHWAPENFVGSYEIAAAQGHWTFGSGGSWGASATQFFGDGTYWPVASLDFVDYTVLAGIGAGSDGTYEWGELWLGKQGPVEQIEPPVDYQVITTAGEEGLVLFETDQATLDAKARQIVRELCTRHRALFGKPQTRLVIEGFASTTGSAEYNLNLSRRRAAAVYQALRDHLGERLRIPWRSTEVRGLGEVPALPGGDEQESPQWRKVTISLDGVIVLDLVGVANP